MTACRCVAARKVIRPFGVVTSGRKLRPFVADGRRLGVLRWRSFAGWGVGNVARNAHIVKLRIVGRPFARKMIRPFSVVTSARRLRPFAADGRRRGVVHRCCLAGWGAAGRRFIIKAHIRWLRFPMHWLVH